MFGNLRKQKAIYCLKAIHVLPYEFPVQSNSNWSIWKGTCCAKHEYMNIYMDSLIKVLATALNMFINFSNVLLHVRFLWGIVNSTFVVAAVLSLFKEMCILNSLTLNFFKLGVKKKHSYYKFNNTFQSLFPIWFSQ